VYRRTHSNKKMGGAHRAPPGSDNL